MTSNERHPFKEQDFQSIFEGTAFTSNAPKGCHRLLRYTPEEIQTLMSKSSIKDAYERRVYSEMKQVLSLIEEGQGSWLQAVKIFSAIRSMPRPFGGIRTALIKKSNQRDADGSFTLTDSESLKLFEAEPLLNIDVGLSRFAGGGGADILTMNSFLGVLPGLYKKNPDMYRECMNGRVRYMEIIAHIVCLAYERKYNLLGTDIETPLTAQYLDSLAKGHQDVFERSISYELQDADSEKKISKYLIDGLLELIPLHIGDPVNINLIQKENIVEVVGSYNDTKTLTRPRDLIHHQYSSGVDGSYFLQWMVDVFPELSFEVRDKSFVFKIKNT